MAGRPQVLIVKLRRIESKGILVLMYYRRKQGYR